MQTSESIARMPAPAVVECWYKGSGSDEPGGDYVGVQTGGAATCNDRSLSRRAAADFASASEFWNGLGPPNWRSAQPFGTVGLYRSDGEQAATASSAMLWHRLIVR